MAIIRLHNLSARMPILSDVRAVTILIAACECTDASDVAVTEAELWRSWQALEFDLRNDAWVIVTNKGYIIGYADVRRERGLACTMQLYVHPEYRERGIETLLLWLVEVRARILLQAVPVEQRAMLTTLLRNDEHRTRALLEHECYEMIRRFWRVIIPLEATPDQARVEYNPYGVLKVDLVVDADDLLDTLPVQHCTAAYRAHQYEVYTKDISIDCLLDDVESQLCAVTLYD